MKPIFKVAAASFLCLAPNFAVAQARLPNSIFWDGFNEAWFGDNYGNWLASNPVYNQSSQYTDVVYSFQRNMIAGMSNANSRAKIVRVWLFPALQGIQSPVLPQTPHIADYSPTYHGLTPDFLKNLTTFIARTKKKGLSAYLTLWNCGDARQVIGYAPLQTFFSNLFLNRNGEFDNFKNYVLRPLLTTLNQIRANDLPGDPTPAIYALDMCNEIDTALNYFPNGWAGARAFLANYSAFVRSISPWLPVTSSVSSPYGVQEITFGLLSGIGLTIYDDHNYSDTGTYSGQSALCQKVRSDKAQIILGEFAQRSSIYSDSLQATVAANYLYGAKSTCFSSALAWKFESTNQPWFTYLKTDGTCCRPAYSVIQSFGTSP
ncbi:hypothetical protein [Methylocystis parvus]|uniref:hypothetical protein n=1 Tax=Methylocystis parvus TaxID=134 RepID=UPI003C7768CC